MKQNKTVYIILSTSGVGGAEKRFLELWLFMQKKGVKGIKLVLSKETFTKLIANNTQFPQLENYMKNIIFWEFGNSYLKKRDKMKKFMFKYHLNNTIFHFILTFPIMIPSKYNTILTYPSTAISYMNLKGQIITYLSFLKAKKIDMLDPTLYKLLQKYFFWKKRSFTNTPGSFVDTNFYTSAPIEKKKNWLVFLGRFEEVKQILIFAKSIPSIYKKLKEDGVKDIHFFILGKGSLEEELKCIILSKEFEQIPLKIYFDNEPMNILKYSRIFFSLQKYTNYPSKSLLEAISCGNIPIVTDNRDTRLIADKDFSFYVPENFTPQDLVNACTKVFKLDNNEYNKMIEKEITFLKQNFSIESSLDYYLDIYEKEFNANKV